MSCKNLIYTAMTSPTAVAAGGTIPLGTITRRYGCDIDLVGSGIAITESGYYDIDANVTVAATAAGTIAATLYVNGVPYPGATAAATAAAGNIVTLPISAIVRAFCCNGPAVLTLVLSAVGTVSNVAFAVERA